LAVSKRLFFGLLVAAMTFASQQAAAQVVSAQPDDAAVARIGRSTLLAVHLEDMERRSDALPWGLGLGIALGATELGAGLFVEDLAGRAGFIAGGAWMFAGSIASFAVSEEWRAPLGFAALYGGMGITSIGLALDDHDFRVPGLAIGIGFNTSVALMLISTALRPQTPTSSLARDYARLRDPKVRAGLSEQDIAAIEARYRRLTPAIPPLVLFAPMLVGNAVAGASLMERAKTDEAAAFVGALIFLPGVVFPLLLLLQPSDYDLYEVELEHAGITLQVAPTLGGVGVTGTF
jgi:hypothetical protein